MVGDGVAVGKKGVGVAVAVCFRVGLVNGVWAGVWAADLVAVAELFGPQPATTTVVIAVKVKKIDGHKPNLLSPN